MLSWFTKQTVSFQKQPSRGVLRKMGSKICRKFTVEHPCLSVISIKLQSNFIESTLWRGCSLVNLLHIYGTPFPKFTSGGLPLSFTSASITLCLVKNFFKTTECNLSNVLITQHYVKDQYQKRFYLGNSSRLMKIKIPSENFFLPSFLACYPSHHIFVQGLQRNTTTTCKICSS